MRILLLGVGLASVLGSSRRAMARGGQELTLVRDGQPAATLVTAKEWTRVAMFAALDLQRHVKLITGATLPIVGDDAAVEGNRILVGESAATVALGLRGGDFKPQEYLIKFLPDAIVLMGRDSDFRGWGATGSPELFDEQGTLYAAYDFLERCCDVRWYLPTDLGIAYTERKTLVVAGEDVRRSPYMKYRFVDPAFPYPLDLCGDTVKADPQDPSMLSLPRHEHMLWLLRNRMGGEAYAANHSFYGYYSRFWEADGGAGVFVGKKPEWFAQGYERQPPQMCYTSPGFIQQVIQDARDYFDGKGAPVGARAAGDYFGLVPMDNFGWCKCPNCQALLLPEAADGQGQFSNDLASDYFFSFVNKVAREIKKSHPDKWISTLGYGEYTYPPKEDLESNVNVTLCLHTRFWGWNPDIRANDRAILDAWSKKGNPIYLWMYYCFPALDGRGGNFRIFPGFFAHAIAEQNQIFREAGVRGIFYEPSALAILHVAEHQSALLDQLEFYVTWRLADNPELDGNALIEEFFVRYYGAAAGPMKAFYERVEEIYADPANHPPGVGGTELYWKYQGTEERMAELGRYMEAAKAAARTDVEKQRVALFDKGIWQYMVKGHEDYWKYARIPPSSVSVPRVAAPDAADPRNLDWSKAGVLANWRVTNGNPTDKRIEGRILHDGARLYIRLVDMMDPATLFDSAGLVWHSDEYELFFGRQRAAPYRQIGIHFKGFYEALRHGEGPAPWDSGVAIIPDLAAPDRWTLYVALPLAKLLDGGVKPGETFYMNAVRSMRAYDAVAWNPTLGGYHEPKQFGAVTLLE